MKIGESSISSINRIAGGGRLKFIAIAAGVAVAIVLGPAIIESNEYLKSNYGSFVSWKGGLFGLGAAAPEPLQEVQQEIVEEIVDSGDKSPAQQESLSITNIQEEQAPIETSDETEQIETIVMPTEFTDENFDILQASPDSFAGFDAAISGQVYGIVDQSTAGWHVLSLRMYIKAEVTDESKALVILQTPKEDPASKGIALEDCVVIEGTIRGSITDSDTFGRSIKVPLIDSATVREIDCIDSSMPAYRTDEVEIQQELNGVRLTAQRVQFSEDHIRIKITAENFARGDSVFIREKESFAEQGDKRYDNTSHLPIYTHYRFDSRLMPELLATNYMFFEPATSDEPVVFRVVVEQVKVAETIKSVFIFTIK